jgi:hypothetical protein
MSLHSTPILFTTLLFVALFLTFPLLRAFSNLSDSAGASQVHSKIEHEVTLRDDGIIKGMKMQCLDSENILHNLLSSTDQVIITMPAKAAGNTLKRFTEKCNKASGLTYEHVGNFLNRKEPNHFDGILSKSFRVPPVIASHIDNNKNLIYLIKNAPRSTFLVYVHRDETSRVKSAIHQVTSAWCRHLSLPPNWAPPENFFVKQEEGVCHTTEQKLIDVVMAKKNEIGIGASELLHCETYDSILQYGPNILFMNYKHADDLQSLLSEKYCPGLNGELVKENVGSEKSVQIFVQVKNGVSGGPKVVSLTDWLTAKQSTLEWALGLNENATCTAKTRIMEDNLFGCTSGFIKASVVEG